MKLLLTRFSTTEESTLGLLHLKTKNNFQFLCYILEDTYRQEKIKHQTRIPNGKYQIKYRTEGGFYERYKTRFHDINNKRGMLELQNVKDFKYVLIHPGNNKNDTSGCLITGNHANNNTDNDGYVGASVDAYKKLYRLIAITLDDDQEVTIKIEDFKTNFKL